MFEHPAVFDDFLSGKLPANCSVQRSGLQLLLCRQPIQGDTWVSNRRGISSVSSNCSPRWLRKATKTNQVAFPSSVQIGQEKCAHFLGAYFFFYSGRIHSCLSFAKSDNVSRRKVPTDYSKSMTFMRHNYKRFN